MKQLLQVIQKKERMALGLMSGTSLDGVDLALVRLSGRGGQVKIKLEAFASYEMDPTIRRQIQASIRGNCEAVCRLNFDLGHYYSRLILEFLAQEGIQPAEVDVIGSHGQTIFHVDGHSSLQVGEADVIARNTGIITIADFRTADIAAGGRGAPLVPYLDWVLFQDHPQQIALQNLGGIGNVTFLPKDKSQPILAFDTGPANGLVNEMVEVITNGQEHYDQDGKFSRQGQIQGGLLLHLLRHPYFDRQPPKTTGREDFGQEFVAELIAKHPMISQLDLLRTLVALVSYGTASAYGRFLPALDLILVAGGGANHPLIMEDLKNLLGKSKVKRFDEVAPLPGDAKEAVAFALFAHERLNHHPTNLPQVTGAKLGVSLGKISLP